ncbi:MAG: hypothetical protein RLZZ15_1562 [Verrucomicrobiota bacterium]
MKERLVIAALAVLCFAAGFGARWWTEDDGPAVPPPSAVLGSEFTAGSGAPAKPAVKIPSRTSSSHGEPNRSRLAADVQRLRPQIDAYRARLEELDRDFDRQVLAILTSEQREKFAARQKRLAERRAKDEARDAADSGPLSDDQLSQLQQRPLWNVLWSVSVEARYERLDKELKFDAAQQARVKELYRERREKFIALVDTVPPPTITLSLLAPQARKIGGDPAKK